MSSSESIATPVRPDLAERERVVGVEAELRRQVERDREARLAALEQQPEARVRLLGRARSRRTGASSTAGRGSPRADAARERELARAAGAAPGRRRGRRPASSSLRTIERRSAAGEPRASVRCPACGSPSGCSPRSASAPAGRSARSTPPTARPWATCGRRSSWATSPRPRLRPKPRVRRAQRSARRRRRGRGHPARLGRRVPRSGRSRSTSTPSWPRWPTPAPARSRPSSGSRAFTAAAAP